MYKTYIYTHACRHKLVLHFNPSTLCDHWFIRWIIWGFSVLFSQPQKAPLKTSLQFPNGLSSCLRKKGRGKREGDREKLREKQKEKQRWSFKMIAMFPKGLASVQGEFFREQTVKCVLSNEATVKLSQSLFSALLVRSGHWEHMFSLYHFSLPSHGLSLFSIFLFFSDHLCDFSSSFSSGV